jgi:hypothetical protein
MFVKPAPGIKVRHPQTKQHIPETGLEVPEGDTYWIRRLLDGDVLEVKPDAQPLPPPAKGTKE